MFLIIKDKSERVFKKNFQLLDGKPLHQYFIDKRKNFDVYIDTDSDEILKFYSNNKYSQFVTVYKRLQEHVQLETQGNTSPAPLMIKRFLETYAEPAEVVVTSHITSPFIEDSTIMEALNFMQNHDSVSSVEEVREFAVMGTGNDAYPINFSYEKIVKTQSLQPVSILNGAFFILRKDVFINNGNKRISNKHFYFNVSKYEALDIDNYEDLKLAKLIAKEQYNEIG